MGTDIVTVYQILGAAASVVVLLCMGHIKWMVDLKKTIEARLLKLEEGAEKLRLKQTQHDSIFVTEQRTREVIKEELGPLKEDVQNLNVVVSEVRGVVMNVMERVSALVTEVRIINAIREAERGKE
jgi:predicted phosphohydrolase